MVNVATLLVVEDNAANMIFVIVLVGGSEPSRDHRDGCVGRGHAAMVARRVRR